MAFFQVRQLYRSLVTGKISPHFVEVLSSSLTLNADYKRDFYGGENERSTPFKEIEVLPAEEIITPEMQEVMSSEIGSVEMNGSQFFLKLKTRFEKIIEENWKPAMNHVVMHSSGWDTRIISWYIMKLSRKHGSDWLGKTVFLCSKKEGSGFKQIMEYEGWNPDQYLVIGENLKEEDVFAPIFLDFKNAWHRCNGTFLNPLNPFIHFPLVAHQEIGFPLENIQMWTGFSANELFENFADLENEIHLHGLSIMQIFKRVYYSPGVGARPMFGNQILPFTDAELLRLTIQSSTRIHPGIRLKFAKAVDRQLGELPNLNPRSPRAFDCNIPIASEALEQAIIDYRNSWYGQKVRPNLIWLKQGTDCRTLCQWTIASLCEYLLERGYRIKTEQKQ